MLSISCLYILLYNMCVLLFSNITISISRDSYKHSYTTNGITLPQMNTSYFTCNSHVVSQFIQIVVIINNTLSSLPNPASAPEFLLKTAELENARIQKLSLFGSHSQPSQGCEKSQALCCGPALGCKSRINALRALSVES